MSFISADNKCGIAVYLWVEINGTDSEEFENQEDRITITK